MTRTWRPGVTETEPYEVLEVSEEDFRSEWMVHQKRLQATPLDLHNMIRELRAGNAQLMPVGLVRVRLRRDGL